MQLLRPRNLLQPLRRGGPVERLEPELATPARERLDDARDVVAHEAKPRDAAVLLHRPAQRGLRVLRHAVRLIQDHDLEGGTGVFLAVFGVDFGGLRKLRACKVLDLLADNVNASLVGGVELEDAGAVQRGAKEGFGEGEDCGCFAGAGGSVEEHVWELIFQSVVGL